VLKYVIFAILKVHELKNMQRITTVNFDVIEFNGDRIIM